jgi:glycerol-3-phosphate dehydrogenase
MERNLSRLEGEEYDLLIVGAGIYGACTAWDAALRGLKVAVVERNDFGSGTSQNSLKIIHGGLRYLQQADIGRMRESIRERRTLMKIAPQFVHPLPCLMPTYGHCTKGREALSIALLMNDVIGFDRNRLDDPSKYLPRGRTLSRKKILELLPGVRRQGLTGGALWYDCQTHNSERLLLSFLLGASRRGAQIANYAEVTGFLTRGNRVYGAVVVDGLSRQRLEIRSKMVINAAGPWINNLLRLLDDGGVRLPLKLSSAMNLVTRKLIRGHAAGISSIPSELIEEDTLVREGSRLYFIAPWRDVSLVGTAHLPYGGNPDDYAVTEQEVTTFLGEINQAYPSAELRREDVYNFYGGLLPMKGLHRKSGEVNLLKHFMIVDHTREDNWDGIISLLGVKYTTARNVAEKAVDLAIRKLGVAFSKSTSDETPVHGGQIKRFNDFLDQAIRSKPERLSDETMEHLVYNYGSAYPDIVKHCADDPGLATPLPCQMHVIEAEVLHAVREEMAVHLTDVVARRTELGSDKEPGNECLSACAVIMARVLGWDDRRKREEIEAAKAVYIPKPSTP